MDKRKLGITLASLLGLLLLLYLGGLLGLLLDGYAEWLAADGISGAAGMRPVRFSPFICIPNAFTAGGLKGSLFLLLAVGGLIVYLILNNRFGKAEGWTHIAGQPRKRIFLTEGPLKADIVHALSGQTVLAVPGVNALTHLDIALDRLCERDLSHVYVAFDMDLLINPHVQNGYRKLLQLLSDHGLTFSTCLWDSRQKGIDDYLWAQVQGRRQ